MIKIRCVNVRCPAKAFMWNESAELHSPHHLTKQDDPDAVRLMVNCTYCGSENIIWVKKSGIKSTPLHRGDEE